MRRRPTPVRASLVLAVLVTVLTLLLGSALVPSGPAEPEPTVAADLVDAPVVERDDTTSRDQARPTEPAPASAPAPASESAGATTAPEGLPSYSVQDSGQPIAELPPYNVRESNRVLRRLPPGPVPGDPFTFNIGTLNILGSQHAPGGTSRASALAGAIMGRGVDVVGLQEVQDDQLAVMQSRLSGYTVWPGQALGNQGVRLQIAFRDSMFELVDTGSISTTFDFQSRPIPYVLLRERATQGEFYVIDIHNSPGGQERDRDSATGAQIGLINELEATGKPVFVVGDTNERTEFACRVAAATGMVGSNGLSAANGCSVGAGPLKIDWVLGSGGVDFSGHVVDYGAPVAASTDHAFVRATATVTPMVSQQVAAETAGD